MTRILLTYRQLIFIMVYSHLLRMCFLFVRLFGNRLISCSVLDPSSQVWWRWANIMFTLFLWAVELVVSPDGDDDSAKWKID